MNALVADRYFTEVSSSGRAGVDAEPGTGVGSGGVFLAGDAAHQFPPAGGFGLNTGVQVGARVGGGGLFLLGFAACLFCRLMPLTHIS